MLGPPNRPIALPKTDDELPEIGPELFVLDLEGSGIGLEGSGTDPEKPGNGLKLPVRVADEPGGAVGASDRVIRGHFRPAQPGDRTNQRRFRVSKTITTSKRRTVEFLRARLGPWAEHAELLQLSEGELTSLQAAYAAARDALREAELAREKAIAATALFDALGERAEAAARKAVRRIRFTASTSEDPSAVYAAGRLDPPGKPGPKRETPVPGVPSTLTLTLDSQGRAVVSFVASRSGGAAFEVERQVVTLGTRGGKRVGPWAHAGTTLTRPFVDERTPSGVAGVAYRVRARRPGASSDWSAAVVLVMGVGAPVA